MNGRMLMAIGIIIASISIFITFVSTFASASLSNPTINIPPENTTDSQNGTKMPETKPPQSSTPSESLTIGGLSPQEGNNLATACGLNPEGC